MPRLSCCPEMCPVCCLLGLSHNAGGYLLWLFLQLGCCLGSYNYFFCPEFVGCLEPKLGCE